MTTLGRNKSALLVIDVQNQVVDGAYNKDAVIAQINVAVDEKIAAEAARIRAANKISLPDAIISATAEASKAQLWSCDNGLVKSHRGSKFISVDS